MNTKRRCSAFLLAALMVASSGCGGNSAPSSVVPAPPATPTPQPVHLYLSQGSVYTLPITNASTPAFTISANGAGIALDAAHRLYVANPNDGSVAAFASPIKAGATPAFIFASGLSHANGVSCDASGDLLVVGHKVVPPVCRVVCRWIGERFVCTPICFPQIAPDIEFITTPFGSSSITTTLHSDLLTSMSAVALDANGNAWTTNGGTVREFQPPFDKPSTPAFTFAEAGTGIAFDAKGDMFVGTSSGVDMFQPPFNSPALKSFTISATNASYLAFDPAGNLYVTTTSGTLLVFDKRLSGASVPSVTLAIPGGSAAGIAIGP